MNQAYPVDLELALEYISALPNGLLENCSHIMGPAQTFNTTWSPRQVFNNLPVEIQNRIVSPGRSVNDNDLDNLDDCLGLLYACYNANNTPGAGGVPVELVDRLFRAVPRKRTDKGTGSRGGNAHYDCLWPGCGKSNKRKLNARYHTVAVHGNYKQYSCDQWYVVCFYGLI